jgi:signal peptide peptidase SppA
MSWIDDLPFIDRFRDRAPVVPVVRLAGVIAPAGGLVGGRVLLLAGIAAGLHQAVAMKAAPAVALAINSPGGSPVQSALIHDRIRELSAEKKKPVLAFVEDVAASGGYWLALAGDEIFVDPSSIVGSIGVISAGFGFQEAIARLGIERRVHAQGRAKSMLDPFRPERPEDLARLDALQKEIHARFIDHVRARREGRLKEPHPDGLFEGEIFTGQKGVEIGLVDGIGHLRGVLRARFGDKVKLRVFGADRGWLRRRLGLAGATADLAEGLAAAIETRAHWQRYGL